MKWKWFLINKNYSANKFYKKKEACKRFSIISKNNKFVMYAYVYVAFCCFREKKKRQKASNDESMTLAVTSVIKNAILVI